MTTTHVSAAATDQRGGFSLLELALVLALLATLAAIAWPTLQQSVDDLRLRRSADQVRAAWASARIDAVTAGRIMAFCCRTGEARYRIEPFELEDGAISAAPLAAPAGQQDVRPMQADGRDTVEAASMHTTLPKGITIVATSIDEQSGDQPPSDTRSAAQGTTAPILFFADGTASDCQLTLADERGWRIRLTLRAITGMSTASNLVAPDGSRVGFNGSSSP